MMAELMRVQPLGSRLLFAHPFDPFEGIEDLREDECRVDDFLADDF